MSRRCYRPPLRIRYTVPGFDNEPCKVVVEIPTGTTESFNWQDGVLTILLFAKRSPDRVSTPTCSNVPLWR